MTTRSFGRRKSIDPRDGLYPLRRLVQIAEGPVRTRPWNAPPPLDQGDTGIPARDAEGSCTGFGGAHFLAAAPHEHPVSAAFALTLYDAARQNDEWPGSDYDGSSVRGLMKALTIMKCIEGGYHWAKDAATVRDYVLRVGPVVSGTSWYRNMMETVKGYVTPTGPEEGGHCYCILGYSASRDAFRIQNSWGPSWGDGGRCWIKFDDYGFLLEQDGGEAASAVEVLGTGY